MSRTTKTDIDRLLEHGIFLPTKTMLLFGEIDEELAEYAITRLPRLTKALPYGLIVQVDV